MIIDLLKEVRESKDSELLNAMLRELIGCPCLKVELAYGGELTAHFGSPRPYPHPRLADEFKGAWILGTRGSRWTLALASPPYVIASDNLSLDAAREIEEKSRQLAGLTVLDVFTGKSSVPGQADPGESLLLRFSNGAHISVTPTEDPDNTRLPDWELFTPHGTYLTCGPGDAWSYLRSGPVARDQQSAAG